MASNYPTSLDNFTNPTSNDSLNSPSHSLQHANINDAVEAIEAKLGIGASPAGSATSGYVLTAGTGGTTTWQAITPSPFTQISSGTVTAQSALNLSSVFTDSYKFYDFIWIGNGSASVFNNIRFRENTTDKTTGYQVATAEINSLGASGNFDSGTKTSILVGRPDSMDFFVKATFFRNSATKASMTFVGLDTPNYAHGFGSAYHTSLTNWNGFSFYPSSGTITGYYSLVGYN